MLPTNIIYVSLALEMYFYRASSLFVALKAMQKMRSLKLQIKVFCSRLGVLYFREHHSRTENLKSLKECPLSVKCLDTGVILFSFGFFTERMCSYILDLNARPVSPT